jgi:hypothetical protein
MEHSDPERRLPYTVRESALVILALLTLFTEDEIKKLHIPDMPISEASSLVRRMLGIDSFPQGYAEMADGEIDV